LKAASVRFTIEQINDLHARLGSARTLAEYVRALKALGVERYDSYLAGHSEYFGQGGHRVVSHRCTRCFPSLQPVNARRSFRHLGRHEWRGGGRPVFGQTITRSDASKR
jgi:hypothetical protein